MPSPPRIIADRYRVIEEAGRGGMGSVWRCTDERLGREVAVKQVGLLPGESVTDRARALREARSTAALNHPNVVSVYDAVAEDDHVWLVMEYVVGRTLSQILREEGSLPPARAARLGAQVADGLAAAHARGTVHRDVKPGNVLVTADDRAKISDFGIARTAGDDTLTQSGMVTGTPNYLAPEVARGGDPRPASDVWALGATLYAAVEGRAPYDTNPNALAVLAVIASEEPPDPEHAGPLTEPIRRMLDRDPGSRWSMADVAHALHRVAAQASQQPDTLEETRARAEPAAAAAPVVASVATPAEPVAAPPQETADEPASARRRSRGLALAAGLVALLLVAIAVLLLVREDPAAESPAADEDTTPSATEDSSEASPEEPESSPTTSPETSDAAPAGGAASRTAFVEDYYGVLPEDTESGYAQLSPAYQDETSFADYDGFWSTVDSVDVQDATPSGSDAVDVTLVYDGGDEEVRRIYLEPTDDGWLITGDEIVG